MKIEGQAIPVEVGDGITTYLQSDSAEAKALERIASPIADEEWIVVDEVGKEINMEEVKQKFKQRGYQSKVFTSQTPASGK